MRQRPHDFYEDVYAIVAQIPRGRVTTYGAIAHYLGTKMSARMVGFALNNLPSSSRTDIPAHRVVNRNGFLSGKAFFPPERPMDTLLITEGLHIENDQIKDFKTVFWNPTELDTP